MPSPNYCSIKIFQVKKIAGAKYKKEVEVFHLNICFTLYLQRIKHWIEQ